MKQTKQLSNSQRLSATLRIAATAYRAAPMSVILQMIGALFSAVIPLVTTYFAAATTTALVEAYAGNQEAGERALELVVVTAVLGIATLIWSSFESYFNQIMEFRINAAISDQMYEHFMSLAFWRYDDKETADLYEKANRFAMFFPSVFRSLARIITDFFSMTAGIIALIMVSWWLGLIVLAAILPGLVIQIRLSRLQNRHWSENVQARRVVNWVEYGMMQPGKIAELRLYGLVKSLLALRSKMRDKDQKQRIQFERQFIWKRLGADVLESAVELVALVWVTMQIIARQQPVGQFLYVQQVVGRALAGSKGFVSGLNNIDEDLANLFDYQQFMDLPLGSTSKQQIPSMNSNILLQNVSFKYPGSKSEVLHNVSIDIKKGQRIAVVGENGAGKSTLIKILVGLYEPSVGQVLVDTEPLAEYDIASWHKQLAVLSQDFVKYDFATAHDNIAYGDVTSSPSKSRIEGAIDAADADFLFDLPLGLGNYVNQWMEDDEGNKGQDLSGGQWQRLALARNFFRQADIVVLDEPTSAIDALAESRIFKRLMSEKGKTMIIISHRLTTVQKADHVIMLKDGVVAEEGKADELISAKGEFYKMFESQIK